MKSVVEEIAIDSLVLSTSGKWTATCDPRGVPTMMMRDLPRILEILGRG